MLNDWEERELADIERRLRSDSALERLLARPTARERLWLAFGRWFYPCGYLVSALIYAVMVMGGHRLGIIGSSLVVTLVVWVVVEVRVIGLAHMFRQSWAWVWHG